MKNFIENTKSPFGIKELNDNYYLFCLLSKDNEHHMKIKKNIISLENTISKKNINYNFKSNLYKYNENFLIKFRIRKIKKNLKYDLEYKNNINYLKTIHNISNDDNISINFIIGKIYKTKYQEKNIISFPLFISKIIFE